MILQQLYKDSDSILGGASVPEMYKADAVRWIVPLTKDGQLDGLNWIQLGDARRGKELTVPYPGVRTSGPPKPALIVDYPAYVLGIGESKERPAAKHQAYRALIKECLSATGSSEVSAVDRWLDRWDSGLEQAPDDLVGQDRIAFTVDGDLPTDLPAVQAYWSEVTLDSSESGPSGTCLISGLTGRTLSSMPSMLKGIPGGQTSGVAIVSNNASSFESYGHKGAHGAPIVRKGAEKFTKALNHLLAGERTKIRVGNIVYVFWTTEGADTSVYSFLNAEKDPGEVRTMISSAWTGKKLEILSDDDFYAVALSASGARAVVRDWLHTTVPLVRRRLAEWFAAQEIVTAYGESSRFFSVYSLVRSLYRDGKDIEHRTVQPLVRAALHGSPISESILTQAVMRCRTEQTVTNQRAALIKAILVLQSTDVTLRKEKAQSLKSLDFENDSPAYHCGRLLAELEAVQRAALGPGINSTLTDRYYGAASTSPAIVFGMLLSNASKAHLPKLRKSRRAVYEALQQRVEEILSHISAANGFPKTLKLVDQALFSLGFYHQRAYNRGQAALAKQAKSKNDLTAEQAAYAELSDEQEAEIFEGEE